MIILRPTNLHWIKGEADDPKDLCAHSGVDFSVDNNVLVAASAGDWTVSASALYLLRTLSKSHTKANPVGEHLFPCCGHSMYAVAGEDDVVIIGCPNGIDFEVVHTGDDVVITEAGGREHRVRLAEWREAVRGFSDAVQSFYATSSPKQPCDVTEAEGFEKFMAEWMRRRSLVGSLS